MTYLLYTSILSRYTRQKSNPVNIWDMRLQNTLGSNLILKGATFQCHLSLVVAEAVFGFASGVRPI